MTIIRFLFQGYTEDLIRCKTILPVKIRCKAPPVFRCPTVKKAAKTSRSSSSSSDDMGEDPLVKRSRDAALLQAARVAAEAVARVLSEGLQDDKEEEDDDETGVSSNAKSFRANSEVVVAHLSVGFVASAFRHFQFSGRLTKLTTLKIVFASLNC